MKVTNFSLILNSTNMDVILKPFYGKNDQPRKNITNWEVINITGSEMKIQVNFTDPSLISPRMDEEDKITIILREGGRFRNQYATKVISDNYTLMSMIPRQIVLTNQIVTI